MLARKAFQDSSRDLLADNHPSCVALQLSGENLQLWLWLFRMRSGRRVIRWTLSPWCLCTPNPRCFLRLSANRDEPVTINWSKRTWKLDMANICNAKRYRCMMQSTNAVANPAASAHLPGNR